MPAVVPMSRRAFLSLAAGGLAAACSPLGLLNATSPGEGGVRRIARDLRYGSDPRQALDLYAPGGRMNPLPVVVFFYGGSWNSGSKDLYGWAARALAAQGFLVALPDSRLVPDVHFPAFVEDAAAATARVVEVAAEHGGDPGRLAVAGHSAGAYLALMIALDRRYMASAGQADRIRAAAGLSGPYDFLPFDVPASRDAFGRAPDPTLTQPVAFARGDAPPLWLAHGAADTTVEPVDSTILAERVRAAGGRAEARLYPDLNHADTIATFSPFFRRKAPVLADLSAFLHRELG
jgi:acetyl esterase/lipase